MNKTAIADKLQDLQAQITLIRRTVIKSPDFDIDEENWDKVKGVSKKVRKALYKQVYGKNKN